MNDSENRIERVTNEALDVRRFEALVRRHSREIEMFLLKMCGNRHDAEELAQDVFVKAYRKLDTLREAGATRRWLFTIAVHHFNDWVTPQKRKDWRKTARLDEAATRLVHHSRPQLDAQAAELDRLLQAHIRVLPNRQRVVLLLHAAKGFDYPAIASVLGITSDAVKMSLFHARETLRARVTRYLGDAGAGDEA